MIVGQFQDFSLYISFKFHNFDQTLMILLRYGCVYGNGVVKKALHL